MKKQLLTSLIIFFLVGAFFLAVPVFAGDRTSPFTPGETLDPGAELVEPCGPTDDNCFVTALAIGEDIISATQGSVLFAGASGILAQDNSNLFWDDATNSLGIGTTSPDAKLSVVSSGSAEPTNTALVNISSVAGVFPLTVRQNDTEVHTPTLQIFETSNGIVGSVGAITNTMILGGATGKGLGLFTNNSGLTSLDMYINTTGQVGIGTVSPNAQITIEDDTDGSATVAQLRSSDGLFSTNQELRLDFQQDTSSFARIAGYYSGSNQIFGQKFYTYNGSSLNSTPSLTLAGNNMAGINGSSPLANLDISGNVRTTGKASAELTGDIDPTASTAVVGTSTLFTTELVIGDRITVSGETRAVVDITDNTHLTVDTAFSDNANDTTPDVLYALLTLNDSSDDTRVVVNNLGNVGIGGDVGDVGELLVVGENQNDNTLISVNNYTDGDSASSGFSASNNTSSIAIGAFPPSYDGGVVFGNVLGHLGGRSGLFAFTGGGIDIGAQDAASDIRFYTGGVTSTSNERLRILNTGSVGIGDQSPDALLDVKGTVCLDLNADEACTDNTAAISDARLKINVTEITDGLDLVKQLRPVRFTWNGQYNTGHSDSLGFLAQEVETVFPELVITDTAGYKNLDYGKLTAVLASAVQELDLKIQNTPPLYYTDGNLLQVLGEYAAPFFNSVVEKVEGSVVYMRGLVIQALTVGSPEKPTGITIYDTVTGEPRCITSENGELKNKKGDCENSVTIPSVPEIPEITPGPEPTPEPVPEVEPEIIPEEGVEIEPEVILPLPENSTPEPVASDTPIDTPIDTQNETQ